MIYLVLVDRFANGDPTNDGVVDRADPQAFHGGDLQGVIDHLDALADEGVTTLWLSPIWKMRTEPFFGHGAFHGYWTEDLGAIEPRFGTEATLRALADGARARGIGLMLDMVYNHVAPDGEWTRTHPTWFHPAAPIDDWNDPLQLRTHQVHGLPDLDQSAPEVYATLLAATRHWIDVAHPAWLRIDAVRHLDPTFIRRLGDDLRAEPGAPRLIGEIFDGDPVHVADVAREAKLDGVFDFPMHYALVDVACHHADERALQAIVSLDRLYPPGTTLVPFLDNHDTDRIATECGAAGVRRALHALWSVRGTPMLSWGTEVPVEGKGEPANRPDMDFVHHPLLRLIRALAHRRPHPPTPSSTPAHVHVDGEAGWRLVGSAPELGDWDPTRGVPLPADLELPTGTVAWKLVKPAADGGWSWCQGPNRYWTVADGATLRPTW